jgi:plastocyanin
MTRIPTPHRLLALALLVPALVLGACGGDDDAGDGGAGAAGTSTTMAADDAMPAGGESASGDAVKIADFNFSPDTLNVKSGTKVTFTNEDGFAHTVTAKDKAFDSGNLDQGDTFEHTFAEAGTFEYRCAIHNSMTGKVVVS